MNLWRAVAAMSVLLGAVGGFGLAVRYEAPSPKVETQTTVLFGGDAMFDRAIRSSMERNGGDFIFSCITPVFAGADLVVLNLEGPITHAPSISAGSVVGSPQNYHFTFAPETAKLLRDHGIGAVMIGNNHILNEGIAGAYTTKALLAAEKVGYFGSPLDEAPLQLESKSVPLTFIGYNEFAPHSATSAAEALRHIEHARALNRVPVVYAHWGIEYDPHPTEDMKTLARAFVDAGARLVIGSHPHVVGEKEEYRGVPIYYSLGNFIFDQYFSPEVRQGLLLETVITPEGVRSVKEIPVELHQDGRTCPRS